MEGVEQIDAILAGDGPAASAAPVPHFERPSNAPGGESSPTPVAAAFAPPVIDPTILNVMGLMSRETEAGGGG